MIRFETFRASHLKFIKPQAAQAEEHAMAMRSEGAYLLENPYTLSAWADYRCVGAGGLLEIWPHRALAWMILSEGAGAYMMPLVRKVRRGIKASGYKRVELTVVEGNKAGHRFARLVGFQLETPEPMRAYGPTGNAEFMYALVKGD